MPFIPHTAQDVREMLAAIGAPDIESLFDEIPRELKDASLTAVPSSMDEMAIMRLMAARAQQDGHWRNFLGAGAYEHHVPAAVWQIVTRGEFYSAYTPYQAEASQGTLQVLYEYQSMMAGLTGLDVSNASLYDGASGLAEAVLMAVRLHKSSRRILMPRSIHPVYREVVSTIVRNQDIDLVDVAYDARSGLTDRASLEQSGQSDFAALVIPQPNYFGRLEPVHALTDWAHAKGALVVALVNPISLGLLVPPGQWGTGGADIAAGDGQPLGIPLSGGGPYFGFLTCKAEHVRQMPGRVAGRTVDLDGRPGFTLTLQAREQHIRRSKATSNICTNQGLAVTAATIYMALLGPEGLRRVAQASHANLVGLLERLNRYGVRARFPAPHFHEAVLPLEVPAAEVLQAMRATGIVGGLDLSADYPELGHAMLVCTTETKSSQDLDDYAKALASALAQSKQPKRA
ncbi:MAG TPA: aminomethyl-transferring glycine dehydrogenase subunit GcvPA [Burkholderiales bacterium]|nr:aminomethyl-transferring glycine dehydrogenase subunit GcvPA [Burkholderiales bacterium]